MDLDDLSIGDRIEVYTPSSGTYWGFVTAIRSDSVDVDDIAPDSASEGRVEAADIVRRISGVRRDPDGTVRRNHSGRWL
jgi:hypothetical protein